jgi:hypothetical protein
MHSQREQNKFLINERIKRDQFGMYHVLEMKNINKTSDKYLMGNIAFRIRK